MDKAIRYRNTDARKLYKTVLNGILWDGKVSRKNKTLICNIIIKSIATYSLKVWSHFSDKTKKIASNRNGLLEKGCGKTLKK